MRLPCARRTMAGGSVAAARRLGAAIARRAMVPEQCFVHPLSLCVAKPRDPRGLRSARSHRASCHGSLWARRPKRSFGNDAPKCCVYLDIGVGYGGHWCGTLGILVVQHGPGRARGRVL